MGLYRTTPAGRHAGRQLALVRSSATPSLEALLETNVGDLYEDPEDRNRWQQADPKRRRRRRASRRGCAALDGDGHLGALHRAGRPRRRRRDPALRGRPGGRHRPPARRGGAAGQRGALPLAGAERLGPDLPSSTARGSGALREPLAPAGAGLRARGARGAQPARTWSIPRTGTVVEEALRQLVGGAGRDRHLRVPPAATARAPGGCSSPPPRTSSPSPRSAGIVLNAHDITDRKRAEEKLLHDALHDELTGLPNRALFMDRLRQSMERSRREPRAADRRPLPRPRPLQDRQRQPRPPGGRRAADRRSPARLAGACAPSDTIARVGGDEFAILLEGGRDVSDAVRVADRIHDRLAAPINLGGPRGLRHRQHRHRRPHPGVRAAGGSAARRRHGHVPAPSPRDGPATWSSTG